MKKVNFINAERARALKEIHEIEISNKSEKKFEKYFHKISKRIERQANKGKHIIDFKAKTGFLCQTIDKLTVLGFSTQYKNKGTIQVKF